MSTLSHAATRTRGLSLIELMISVLIGLIVVGGSITIFVNVSQTYRHAQQLIALHESMRTVTDILVRDVRGLAAPGSIDDTLEDAHVLDLGVKGFSGCQVYAVEGNALRCDAVPIMSGVAGLQVENVTTADGAEWLGYRFTVSFVGIDGNAVPISFHAAARNVIFGKI